jgi:hypothetical protein
MRRQKDGLSQSDEAKRCQKEGIILIHRPDEALRHQEVEHRPDEAMRRQIEELNRPDEAMCHQEE